MAEYRLKIDIQKDGKKWYIPQVRVSCGRGIFDFGKSWESIDHNGIFQDYTLSYHTEEEARTCIQKHKDLETEENKKEIVNTIILAV